MVGTRVPSAGAPALNAYVDGADVVLVRRRPDGVRTTSRVPAAWASFLRRSDLTPMKERGLREDSRTSRVVVEGDFLRVEWAGEGDRESGHQQIGEWVESAPVYEGDVDPVRRYLSDTGLQVAPPRRCYLDIETDSRVPAAAARKGKARVLCWTLADPRAGPTTLPSGLVVRGATVARGVLRAETDADEARVLAELWRALAPYDQVCAWFGDLFDFPIVRQRSDKLLGDTRYPDPRAWLWMDFAELWERMNAPAAESGAEKSSMALDFVANEVLGVGKSEMDRRAIYERWLEDPAAVSRYCDVDALLLVGLEDKAGYLALNDSVCEVCRCFANTSSAIPTTFVDGYMLRVGVERGIRFPSRPAPKKDEEREKYRGAWCLEPQVTGIRRNVHVVDFSGQYPSIIQTLNLSPETRVPVLFNGPIPENVCRAPLTREGFRTDVVGILPGAVADLKAKRAYWSKLKASLPPGTDEWWEATRRDAAYKRIVNIFYGIAGSPMSRFWARAVAESTSTTGEWLVKKTIDEGVAWGLRGIYGDTDSAFFEALDGAPPLTHARLSDFVAWCNRELYPRLVKELGAKENFIEIAYEKVFERLVLVSKKRYCGVYSSYKGTATCSCDTPKGRPGAVDVRTLTCRDCGKVWPAVPPGRGKPEIRGLEWRRGDVLGLARALQKRAIDLLMGERRDDPGAFVPLVEAARRRVLDEKLAVDDVSMSQSLTKPLKKYAEARKEKKDGTLTSEPAHVQVARILKARGEYIEEGVKVAYVVVDASVSPMRVIPAVDFTGECDRYYIWEDKVYPPTMRLLEAAFPRRSGMSAEELQALDWGRYHKARPAKERAARAAADAPAPKPRRVVPGQGDLFVSPPPEVPQDDGPLVIAVGEQQAGRLEALRDVLVAHPGPRAVEIRLRAGGKVHVLDVPLKVAVSPELRREIERAVGTVAV